MHPRRQGSKTGQKHEMEAFAEKYDMLTLVYDDPVEVVFAIMDRNANGPNPDDEVALRAAEMLLSFRYPRVKSAEGNQAKAPILNFNVQMRNPELPVNAAPAPRLRAPLTVVTESEK